MTDRTYINNTTELARELLVDGLYLTVDKHEYGYSDKPLNTYERLSLDFTEAKGDIEQLSILALALNSLKDDGVYLGGRDAEEVEDVLRDWATDTAESAELPFTYTDRDGDSQTYSPAALWEASGSCSEWEQSAQEGYDYGWNI